MVTCDNNRLRTTIYRKPDRQITRPVNVQPDLSQGYNWDERN